MIWGDTEHEWVLDVSVVNQHDLSSVAGVLTGVKPDGCSISLNYESDTRASARVTTVVPEGESDGWLENARLRITLSVPSQGWYKDMFTGYVTDVGERTEAGACIREYDLDSTLFGIAEDLIPWQITCKKGASVLASVRSILDMCRMPYDVGAAADSRFGDNIFYEPGEAALHMIFDMLGSLNRVDVDGFGRITLKPYTPPSQREPTATIDEDDPRTNATGSATRNDRRYQRPGRAIVTARRSQAEGIIAGWYDAPASSPSSSAVRGYTRAVMQGYSGQTKNPSIDELNSLAKRHWEDAQSTGATWEREVYYMDLWEGDVVNYIPHGKSAVKCLVHGCEMSFGDMVQRLTLKEV